MVKYSVIKFLFEKFPLRRVEYVQSYLERGGGGGRYRPWN